MTHPPLHPISLDALIASAQQRTLGTQSPPQTSSIDTITQEEQARAAQQPTRRRGRKPKSPPRPHQVSTTLSDSEYAAYMEQIDISGLTRAEYTRLLVTNPGRITIRTLTDIDTETLAVLLQCAACLTEMRDAIRSIAGVTPSKDEMCMLWQHHEELRMLAKTIYATVEGIYGNY